MLSKLLHESHGHLVCVVGVVGGALLLQEVSFQDHGAHQLPLRVVHIRLHSDLPQSRTEKCISINYNVQDQKKFENFTEESYIFVYI